MFGAPERLPAFGASTFFYCNHNIHGSGLKWKNRWRWLYEALIIHCVALIVAELRILYPPLVCVRGKKLSRLQSTERDKAYHTSPCLPFLQLIPLENLFILTFLYCSHIFRLWSLMDNSHEKTKIIDRLFYKKNWFIKSVSFPLLYSNNRYFEFYYINYFKRAREFLSIYVVLDKFY
jgi:hypothetical protein